MRFYKDDCEQTVRIRWFFVERNDFVPITPFVSSAYDQEPGYDGSPVGELYENKTPRKGDIPAEALIHPTPCGTEEQWLGDITLSDRLPPCPECGLRSVTNVNISNRAIYEQFTVPDCDFISWYWMPNTPTFLINPNGEQFELTWLLPLPPEWNNSFLHEWYACKVPPDALGCALPWFEEFYGTAGGWDGGDIYFCIFNTGSDLLYMRFVVLYNAPSADNFVGVDNQYGPCHYDHATKTHWWYQTHSNTDGCQFYVLIGNPAFQIIQPEVQQPPDPPPQGDFLRGSKTDGLRGA